MEIPMNGLGTWKIPKDKAADVVYRAIKDIGLRHIDCACDYGNEVEVGIGINRALSEGIVQRDELWITSKLWNTYHRKEHVLLACNKSLNDLGLTYLDLYMIHFPIPTKFVPIEVRYPPEWIYDPSASNPKIELDNVPVHETWEAMEKLVEDNFVRKIGVCNFTVQSIMDLLTYAKIKPYCNQVERHPFLSQMNLVSYCSKQGVKVTAFSPLGSPSYVCFGTDGGLGEGLLVDIRIISIAKKYNKTPAQVLLRWNVDGGVCVIPKSSNIERIHENFSIDDFTLTPDDMIVINSLNENRRFNDPGEFCKGMGGSIPIFD